MKYTLLLLAIFLKILTENGKTQALLEVTMDDSKSVINVDNPTWGGLSSGILKSHNPFYSYATRRNKTLILSAPPGYSMLASIRLIDFRDSSQDILTLYANNSRLRNPARFENKHFYRNKMYDPLETLTYDAPNGQLAVEFKTGDGYSYGYSGFQLTFTVYSKFTCNSLTFQCSNKRCIADDLRCDGYNHCGDRSDQTFCFDNPSSGSRVAAIISGVVFLLVAASCAIFITVRRAMRSRVETQTIISQPVATYPPEQLHPPPYGYPGTIHPPPPPPYSQGVINQGYY